VDEASPGRGERGGYPSLQGEEREVGDGRGSGREDVRAHGGGGFVGACGVVDDLGEVEDLDEEIVAEVVEISGSGVEAAELPFVVLGIDEGDAVGHDDDVFAAVEGERVGFEVGADGVGEGGGAGMGVVEGQYPKGGQLFGPEVIENLSICELEEE
jgi:hypothetical protein